MRYTPILIIAGVVAWAGYEQIEYVILALATVTP